MFDEYFGFRENPFSQSQDKEYFYLNKANKKRYHGLLNDIHQRVGLMLLLGERGVGKTMFLQQLIGVVDPAFQIIFFHGTGQRHGLIDYLCNEMVLATDSRDLQEKVQLLAERLAERHQRGINPVLIIDNTQELEDAVLAPLLRLSRQRINGQPLIQIVLAAVPTFLARFDFPVLRPYHAAISRQYKLAALTPTEVGDFIHFHLRQAGCRRNELFSEPAVQAIADQSAGIPRLINKLCGSALLIASLDGRQIIDEEIIDEASEHCLLRPDPGELVEVKGSSNTKSRADKIPPDRPHTGKSDVSQSGTLPATPDHPLSNLIVKLNRSPNTNAAAKRSRPWLSKLVHWGSATAVVLILLLAATLMLSRSNPEFWWKMKTDVDWVTTQTSMAKENANSELPDDERYQKRTRVLATETLKKRDIVVTRKDQSETAIIAASKPMQPSVQLPAEDRQSGNGALTVGLPIRKPVVSRAKSPVPSEAAGEEVVAVEKVLLEEVAKEPEPSHEHLAVATGLSAKNVQPAVLDEKERQAKNRASARLSLEQSGIAFGVESLVTVAETADNKTLTLLLAGGLPPGIQEPVHGMTALVIAAAHGHSETVQLLLSKDVAADMKSLEGRTALMAAASNGHTDTVRVLVNSGATIDTNDNDGWTALMYAAYNNHLEAAQLLLESGANHRLKNSAGRTAHQIARNRGHQGMMELVAENHHE